MSGEVEEGDEREEKKAGLWFAGEHVAPFVALGTTTGAWWSGEAVGEEGGKEVGVGRLGRRKGRVWWMGMGRWRRVERWVVKGVKRVF